MMRAILGIALGAGSEFETTVVESGADALRHFAQFGADFVILDVWMPELDGPATLAQLRQIPGGASVPVAFLSAKDDPEEIAALRALGVVAVLQKPFDLVEFPNIIKLQIARSRQGAVRPDGGSDIHG
jgi:DNA-binding response OmpR family regulator